MEDSQKTTHATAHHQSKVPRCTDRWCRVALPLVTGLEASKKTYLPTAAAGGAPEGQLG